MVDDMSDRTDSVMTLVIPCVICGKDLKPAFNPDHLPDDEQCIEPADGTVFKAYGNYGSATWDPTPTEVMWLQVNICDPCLTVASLHGWVVQVTPTYDGVPPRTYEPWQP